MSRDFLLEIGVEEMPARFIPDAMTQLKEKIRQFLQVHRVSYENLEIYSTPRRLAVYVQNLAEKQEDLDEELRGPAIRIAKDADGNWSKAAVGFAKGKGKTVEDLYIKEVNGEEFVFVKRHEEGLNTREILPQLETIIASMTFPKNMRWGDEDLKFIRPIRWLVALYGNDVIPLTVAGVKSDRVTYGHRFLGTSVKLEDANEYVTRLEEQYVIVDPSKREARILEQIQHIRNEHPDWQIAPKESLLEELVHLVEYPTVFIGSFNEKYLEVPSEVLITTMRVNQRYIEVESNGRLLPYFVGVRNGDDRKIDLVVKGNEKVLTARLADAQFFYQEDQKLSIDDYNERLKTVVWHEPLGTMADKVERIRELSTEWAKRLQFNEVQNISRAASICKFDLATHMVYEFPELQGLMGYYYAKLFGEEEVVAKAVCEHYYPTSSTGQLPSNDISALIALADKIDTIVGSFLLDIIPTGSQDPYGLRRAAQGIVQILLDREYDLTLNDLFESALGIYSKKTPLQKDKGQLFEELYQFFALRVKNVLQDKNIRYDIIDAILPYIEENLVDVICKAEILQEAVQDESFKKVVEAFTRVGNLAKKSESEEVNPTYFEQDVEHTLYNEYIRVRGIVDQYKKERNYQQVLRELSSLQKSIDAFFEQVLVMVEDVQLRNTRLALLKNLSNLFQSFADFHKLIFP